MKKVLIGIVAIIVIIGAVVYFGGKKASSPTTVTSTPTNQTQVVTLSNISIQNLAFNPQTLTIKAGTEVMWTNNDSVTHSIKSSTINSVPLNAGDTIKYTFKTAGTFNYTCGIHPSMTGTIIIQ